MKSGLGWVFTVCVLLAMSSCKPDKLTPPNTTPTDGRTKFVGVYDVYDTLSNWQYEMEIMLHAGSGPFDSVRVENWGGSFNLYIQHDQENLTNYLNFNGGFGLADQFGNRWAIFEEFDPVFMHGRLVNDTLRLAYFKDNIAFYIADSVPYFRQSYREFAVKRDWQ